MSCKCELSGKGVQHGNNVSHSQRKTRRKFKPNIRKVRFFSDALNQEYVFSVSAACLRTVEKVGGFDQYLTKISADKLFVAAKAVKRKVMARLAAVEDATTI